MSATPLGGRAPVQRRAIDRVDRLLAAAADLLVTDGPAGLKMTEVAAAAGVPVGSLYQYFPSRASLVHALAERHLASWRDRLAEHLAAVDGGEGLGTVLERAVRAYLAAAGDPVAVAVIGAIRIDPQLRAIDKADSWSNAGVLAAALHRVAPGASRAELQARAYLVIEAAGELILDLADAPAARRRHLTDAMVAMALAGPASTPGEG